VNPLSLVYASAVRARAALYASGRLSSRRLPAPVISVGNLTFGGTGKTPLVEFLARRLKFEGFRPAILSRGYGRRSRVPVLVSRGEGPLCAPEEGGDEPVAIARRLRGVAVAVAARREQAARLIADLSCDVFLMDDGFQHLSVKRDANLLLLDASDPFGGGALPPAGRLREPLDAIRRADAIVFTRVERGAPSAEAERTVALLCPGMPVYHAAIRPDGLRDEAGSPIETGEVARRRCVAACGVARPSSFQAALSRLELAPEETFVFADHHRYSDRNLKRIRRAADRTGASFLVTTEKDAVKIAGRVSLPVVTVRLEVEVAEPGFFAWLLSRIPLETRNSKLETHRA
jgi:tetraacyldisaccharide 4'-kinase